MSEIQKWLEAIGLGQYADAFDANEIGMDLLGQVDDQMLKDIGVTIGGHRLRIRNAIAKLSLAVGAENKAPTPPIDTLSAVKCKPPLEHGAEVKLAEQVGERRYLTVMFCDLVGSTSISAQLDAEDWRELIGSYLDAASAGVTEMGGRVAKKLGDGLMALFGYPVAQENDAERAARAALSIQRALAKVNRRNAGVGKPTLNARIGIETGSVVIDAAGEIYGDAPNIAARVQALAEPGAVLITARVQRQVAGLFVAEERGTHTLKGVPEPTALFRLIRASGGGRRSGVRQLTPFVGREEEMAMLVRRWERARQGDGQLVLIVGEPGLGKSRLIEEFHARLSEVPHTWVEWSCSQLLQNTPLHPIADWGRQRFGVADVPAEQRLADLENTMALVKLDPADNAPLLAPLLDIPLPKEHASTLVPEEFRRRQLAALTHWVIAGARTQPAVLAFEDLHWADPTTLDLLRGIAERGALAPLFVLITARPEFRPPWGIRSHHSMILLTPLDRQHVREIVAELTARHALPEEVVEGVTERTGGVPLFVEEVTRLLLERGEQGGTQAIPPTLQQSLTARLDRLGPARELAQIGAVIGRDFPYELLRAVAGMEDGPLQAALERLAEADILLVQGLPPESDYRFKHALIQDAAYENLLKSRRQVLHRRVAEILRDRFAASASALPEALAHHFTQAGLAETAIEWWGKAGEQALQRSAYVEAIGHLGKATGLIDSLPGRARRWQEIKLQAALITPLIHVKGYAAPETKAAAERGRLLVEEAERLGESIEDPLVLLSILYGSITTNMVDFDGDLMLGSAAQLLAFAEQEGTTGSLITAHRMMGICLLYTGHLVESQPHLQRTLALYDPAEHRALATRFGQDARAHTLCYRSLAFWLLGFPEAALADAGHAVKDARDIGQAGTLMTTLTITTLSYILCGNYAAARSQADELVTLADEKAAVYWKAAGMWINGWLSALSGHVVEAAHMLTSGTSALRSTGATLLSPTQLSGLGAACAELGQIDDAWRCIDEAVTLMETKGERWFEPEVLRLAGEVALKSPEPHAAKAEEYFDCALAVARDQQAKSWELRAATSLARLWRDQNKRTQAHDLLAPVYGGFTEGFDTLDLKEAKALLEQLKA
jgi:class 3 adenylate cyclase/predicted ATPase